MTVKELQPDTGRNNSAISEIRPDTCQKCESLAAILEIPPWLFDGTDDVINTPRKHDTWCKKRAQYEANKAVSIHEHVVYLVKISVSE